ncbi:hypothetical protein GCM10009558_082320 [Virgisporangium aurantiacum]
MPGWRGAYVLRHVRGARLQHGEDAHEHRQRPAQEQAHGVAGSYAVRGEQVRQGVGAAVELAVGDRAAVVLGGDRVGRPVGPAGDRVMDRVVRNRLDRSAPELFEPGWFRAVH